MVCERDGTGTAAMLRDLPGFRRLALASTGSSAVSALLVLAQAGLLVRVLTDVVLGRPRWGEIAVPVAALAAVFASRAALSWLRDTAVRDASRTVTHALRNRVLAAIDSIGPARLSRERGGELATLPVSGVDELDGYLTWYLPQASLALLVPPAVLARIAVADPMSAGIIAATLPLIPIFGALVGMHTRRAARGQWRALAELGGHFLDVVRGLPTLRAFGRSRHQVGVVRVMADSHRRATMRTLRIAFLSGLTLELVATLSVAVVAVPLGLRLLHGDVGLTSALLVLFLAPEAYRPLRELGTAFHAAASGRAAAEQAFQLIDESGPSRAATAPRAPLADGVAVSFTRATVSHPGSRRPALRDVDLRIGEGERVALLGASGAGKSTILATILGFLGAESGRVDLAGTDLATLCRDENLLTRWRERVAWVPQLPHLFAGTVRDNIALGRPGTDLRRVREAAEVAAADGFIATLPHGYDTVLGERGSGLSAGQRQQVALARAFLRDAPLLLLDEPTAGLDAASEAAVADATRALLRGRTAVLATHRTTLLADMDRIVTVEDGHAVTDPEGAVA